MKVWKQGDRIPIEYINGLEKEAAAFRKQLADSKKCPNPDKKKTVAQEEPKE
jgi:hypothetical protein